MATERPVIPFLCRSLAPLWNYYWGWASSLKLTILNVSLGVGVCVCAQCVCLFVRRRTCVYACVGSIAFFLWERVLMTAPAWGLYGEDQAFVTLSNPLSSAISRQKKQNCTLRQSFWAIKWSQGNLGTCTHSTTVQVFKMSCLIPSFRYSTDLCFHQMISLLR